jgi:formate hydrogenlyase subunit 3/multisubunit Na+/H+ antiporter MnhD subunit
VPLILLGCAIKAGAVPLHPWLPVSYAAAPVPATVALAGTMSKAGVLGWLRLLPLGHASLIEWGVPMALVGIFAAFYGVAAGLCQRDAKTALAYSSVSQMGFLSTAVGLGMIVPSGWTSLLPAVLAFAIHHGLAKGALFLTIAVPQRGGAQRVLRTAALAVTAALGLSLAGMTLTSGAVAKAALKAALAGSGAPSATGIVSALSLAAVGTTLLMARVIWLTGGPWTDAGALIRSADRRGARPFVGAWLTAAAVSLSAPWTVMPMLTDPSQAWSASGLPYILAGAAVAAAVAWLACRHIWRWMPAVPAGDILLALEWVAARVWAFAAARPAPHVHEPGAVEDTARAPAPEAAMPPLERSLLRWPVYGLVVLALLAAAAAALVLGAD